MGLDIGKTSLVESEGKHFKTRSMLCYHMYYRII